MQESEDSMVIPKKYKDKVFKAVGDAQKETENSIAEDYLVITLCQQRGLEDPKKVRMALSQLVSEHKVWKNQGGYGQIQLNR